MDATGSTQRSDPFPISPSCSSRGSAEDGRDRRCVSASFPLTLPPSIVMQNTTLGMTVASPALSRETLTTPSPTFFPQSTEACATSCDSCVTCHMLGQENMRPNMKRHIDLQSADSISHCGRRLRRRRCYAPANGMGSLLTINAAPFDTFHSSPFAGDWDDKDDASARSSVLTNVSDMPNTPQSSISRRLLMLSDNEGSTRALSVGSSSSDSRALSEDGRGSLNGLTRVDSVQGERRIRSESPTAYQISKRHCLRKECHKKRVR